MTATPDTTTPDTTTLDARMGAFVWWDLDRCKVTPGHLRAVLAAEGLAGTGQPTDIDVPDIDPTSAVRRACQNWAMGRGNAPRYRAEVTAVDNGKVYIGILQHQREGQREVAWKQVELLAYDVQAGGWANQHASDAARDFMAAANDFIAYHDHRFLRPGVIVPQLGRMKAISLRKQGGIYFVPLANLDAARKLKRVVAQLGASELHICVVENDPDARASVAGSAREHVMDQLLGVQEQLGAWRESSRQVRSDSQANVLGQLAELLGLADLYERTLEVSLKDLRAQVQAAQDDAMAILAGKAA